ncbi:hypothetical protein A6R68_20527 [Neotoma lepida]|uniref:Uncharacterized protein n=1 Tax=Neotoma lepida TaxID=56216 RepID=A0A1A6HU48_NEOLE|nr:hypothetical protein A6R68_20527 [Neotoma lepida]
MAPQNADSESMQVQELPVSLPDPQKRRVPEAETQEETISEGSIDRIPTRLWVMHGAVMFGREFCYAMETALVTPILLQIDQLSAIPWSSLERSTDIQCCCQVLQNTTVSAEWPAVTFLMNTAKAGRTRGQNVELNMVVNIPTSAVVGTLQHLSLAQHGGLADRAQYWLQGLEYPLCLASSELEDCQGKGLS